jgi:hypothetical protein
VFIIDTDIVLGLIDQARLTMALKTKKNKEVYELALSRIIDEIEKEIILYKELQEEKHD